MGYTKIISSQIAHTVDILADKKAIVLVRCYYSIPELQPRRVFDLARVLSDIAPSGLPKAQA